MLPFQNGGHGEARHHFRTPTPIEHVVRLYVFDRKLRLLALEALDRIEISVRAGLSGEIAVAHGPHWFEKPSLFDRSFDHSKYLAEIDRQLGNATDVFIDHYYRKYRGGPTRPPCWMLFECTSFGTVSTTIKNLIPKHAGELCRDYGLPFEVLNSWLHTVSYGRNLCAHHSRLWNRTLTIKPLQARRYRSELMPNDKFYALAVVINVMLSAIAPGHDWVKKLSLLLEEHEDLPLDAMGFPPEWRERDFWKSALAP